MHTGEKPCLEAANSIIYTVHSQPPTAVKDIIYNQENPYSRLERPASDLHSLNSDLIEILVRNLTRICASLGSRMKFKTLCYPVIGRNKNTALPSF